MSSSVEWAAVHTFHYCLLKMLSLQNWQYINNDKTHSAQVQLFWNNEFNNVKDQHIHYNESTSTDRLPHLASDLLDHTWQIVVLHLSYFSPRCKIATLTVIAIITKYHLGTNQQDLSTENNIHLSYNTNTQSHNCINEKDMMRHTPSRTISLCEVALTAALKYNIHNTHTQTFNGLFSRTTWVGQY